MLLHQAVQRGLLGAVTLNVDRHRQSFGAQVDCATRLPTAPFRSPLLLGEHADGDEILAELDYLPRQTTALREQGTLTIKPGTKPT